MKQSLTFLPVVCIRFVGKCLDWSLTVMFLSRAIMHRHVKRTYLPNRDFTFQTGIIHRDSWRREWFGMCVCMPDSIVCTISHVRGGNEISLLRSVLSLSRDLNIRVKSNDTYFYCLGRWIHNLRTNIFTACVYRSEWRSNEKHGYFPSMKKEER